MILFDEQKINEAYEKYLKDCEEINIEPWDYESWLDMVLTDGW